jgi:hypothetical protein
LAAPFTLGVRANVQPKCRLPIGVKVEISPKGFTVGVNADMKKNFSICPILLINDDHYGHVFDPKAEKRIPSNLGGQFVTQKCSKLAPSFFGPDS